MKLAYPIMTLTDESLWTRIAAHPMPATSDGVSFVRQLVEEYGIKTKTAERAIEEYRRFLYLSALGQGRTVPTKAVDKVWHLHLTHSRDYWEKLVPETLGGRKVHHTPGTPEGHERDFDDTRARYIAEFGQEPPKGFWQRSTRWSLLGRGLLEGFAIICLCGVLAGFREQVEVLYLGFLIAAFVVLLRLTSVWRNKGNHDAQFDIDIWVDGEAGACGGDCGGCGD